MTKKTISITGATGFIGQVVAEKAVQHGYNVHGLSRHEEGDRFLESIGVTPVRGELTSTDVLRREVQQADIIFHLAFNHDVSREWKHSLPKISTLSMLSRRLSGTAVTVPDPSGAETDESSPIADTELAKRTTAEAHAQAWAQKGVRLAIIRLAHSGQSFYIGDGNHRFSEVYVDDAADLYFLVAEKAAPGEVFIGSGRTTTTYRELANAIGNLLKVPAKSLSFDDVVAISNPFAALFFSLENRASNRKAVEKLGWRPHGPSMLTEIQTGSYVSVADEFRKQKE
ncbi:hypothetical protein BGW42_004977 [Actinomortierella wolfii]|nr:hypothetical protein BGW42_004977 [Actinomortierella wolfii]